MTPKELHDSLKTYLDGKREIEDWHGVRDAAVDIEVLEAKHPHLRKLP